MNGVNSIPHLPEHLSVDYLIINSASGQDLEAIIENINAKCIVLDSSVSLKNALRISRQMEGSGVAIPSIAREGAITINI